MGGGLDWLIAEEESTLGELRVGSEVEGTFALVTKINRMITFLIFYLLL